MFNQVEGQRTEQAAEEAVISLRQLCDDVGIPPMKEIEGVNPSDFPALAEAAAKNVSATSNPREAGAKEYLELFNKAYNSSI